MENIYVQIIINLKKIIILLLVELVIQIVLKIY